jgi:hypothetical protein
MTLHRTKKSSSVFWRLFRLLARFLSPTRFLNQRFIFWSAFFLNRLVGSTLLPEKMLLRV